MPEPLQPTMDDVVELLTLTSDARSRQLALQLMTRDDHTARHLAHLRLWADEAGTTEEEEHWALSAMTLNRDIDDLLAAGNATWEEDAALLDPHGDLGIDYPRLLRVVHARLTKQAGDPEALRALHARLLEGARWDQRRFGD